MNQFMQFVAAHWAATGIGSGVLVVAFISCLPPKLPRTADEWYAYIRESLQTSIPAARHHENPTLDKEKE